jgi:CheY-like chemotaxis protein
LPVIGGASPPAGRTGTRPRPSLDTERQSVPPDRSIFSPIEVELLGQRCSKLRMTQKKVLIVDDDPDVFSLVRPVLEELGMTCLTAGSPVEGLEAAEEHRPDLVLLDLMLPGMSGFGFITELKRRSLQNIPIVVYTQLRDDEIAREILESGASGYVTKTFDPMRLAQIVEAYTH